MFERRTGVELAGAKDSDKKKKALSKLRNACAQVRAARTKLAAGGGVTACVRAYVRGGGVQGG